MSSVIAFDEIFLEIDYRKSSEHRSRLGRACGNLVSSISLLGGKSCIITKLEDDIIGKLIIQKLNKFKVNYETVILKKEGGKNVINFVYREDNIDKFLLHDEKQLLLKEKELNYNLIQNYDIFHFGSRSIFRYNEFRDIIYRVKEKGLKISFNINIRDDFFYGEKDKIYTIKQFIDIADYIKLNIYEAKCISFQEETESILEYITNSWENKYFFLTNGHKGSYLIYNKQIAFIKPFLTKPIDTVGCGDIYLSVILNEICDDFNQMILIAEKAGRIASLSAQYFGVIEALSYVLHNKELNI